MNEIKLNPKRIEHLDQLVSYIHENPDRQVYTSRDFYELRINPEIDESKSSFYCSILENIGVLNQTPTGHAWIVKREELSIFKEDGGFRGLAERQLEEKLLEEERERKKDQLTELQLKQMKVVIKKTVREMWWFWVAAVISLVSVVINIIHFFWTS